jgi:NAD(P)-dependent dehydrogenase (short-subunit alcohol dehydrogenase family)
VTDFPRGLAAFSLDGRKALITGGNRGLGFAFTQALADCGATVAFIGRSADANEAAVKRLADAGVRAHGISADLSNDAGPQARPSMRGTGARLVVTVASALTRRLVRTARPPR